MKRIIFIAVAASLSTSAMAAVPFNVSSGYINNAQIRQVAKYRSFAGASGVWSGLNGYEAILGDADLNPNVQIDFYRGPTDNGTTPYGYWLTSDQANHITVSYDKSTSLVTMTLGAAYNYTRTINLGDLGVLNYIQLDVAGRSTGVTVDFKNVEINGTSIGDFSGTGGYYSWNITGADFTNGFTVTGDIYLGGTMPTGGSETNKVVVSAGCVPEPGSIAGLLSGIFALGGFAKLRRNRL